MLKCGAARHGRSAKRFAWALLFILLGIGSDSCAPRFIAGGGFWTRTGTLSALELRIPWNGETNKISRTYEAATRFRGTCTTGYSVYVYDSTSGALLNSGTCTGGAFDLTADFTSYAEGTVTVKLTQVDGTNTSSSHVSITFTKETTYCKDSANTGVTPNGTGTAPDPFQICTIDQFRSVFITANAASVFEFRDDLDATGVTDLDQRMSGPYFSGTLDGRSFGIYNYTNDDRLVAFANGGTYQDLKFRDLNLTLVGNQSLFGGIDWAGLNNSVLRVSLHGQATSTGRFNGFFEDVGSGVIIIANSWVDMTVTAVDASPFAFVLRGADTVTDSWSRGTYTGGSVSGGVQGVQAGATATFTRVSSSATLSSTAVVGGIAGSASGTNTFTDCVFTGQITHSNSYAGGIIGWGPGTNTISNSYVYANIYATGTVGNSGSGGLVGRLDGGTVVIDKSSFVGVLEGADSLGGLVGTGGNVTITDSYARGSAVNRNGGRDCAGIHASSGATTSISRTYADMDLSGCAGSTDAMLLDTGGVVTTNLYFNSDTYPVTAGWGTPLTASQMTVAGSFTGFTFNAANWVMGSRGPKLYFEP